LPRLPCSLLRITYALFVPLGAVVVIALGRLCGSGAGGQCSRMLLMTTCLQNGMF